MQRGQSMAGPAALIRAVAVRPVLPLDARPDRAFCPHREATRQHIDIGHLTWTGIIPGKTKRDVHGTHRPCGSPTPRGTPHHNSTECPTGAPIVSHETKRDVHGTRCGARLPPTGHCRMAKPGESAKGALHADKWTRTFSRPSCKVGLARWNLPVGTCQLELAIFEQSPWLVARTVVKGGVESIGFTSRRPPGAAIRLQDSNRACSYRRSSRLSPPPFRSTHSQA